MTQRSGRRRRGRIRVTQEMLTDLLRLPPTLSIEAVFRDRSDFLGGTLTFYLCGEPLDPVPEGGDGPWYEALVSDDPDQHTTLRRLPEPETKDGS